MEGKNTNGRTTSLTYKDKDIYFVQCNHARDIMLDISCRI